MSKKVLCIVLFALVFGPVAAQGAEFQWIRAAYWDGRYPTGWTGDADSIVVRDALEAAGYEILDADQLKAWMDARIADKEYSVVVFCRDVAPDTVAETMDNTCTLRRYLDAGGKVVFSADIPLYNQAHADGTNTNWAGPGATAILGIPEVNLWDSNNTVKITDVGAKWGLTQTWASVRPIPAAGLTVLATDNAGNAAAWVKHYVKNDWFRGFVRLWDRGGYPPVEDIIRAAEYTGAQASNPSPADGATGVALPYLTWEAGGWAVFHDIYFGTDAQALTKVDNPWGAGAEMYMPASLEPGVTYYWRVDEVSATGPTYTGDLWSFTMSPLTAWAPMPRDGDKWIDPDVDLTWNAGLDAMQHQVYFSTDQAAVAARDAAALQTPEATYETMYEPGTLLPGTTYYWAIDEVGSAAGEVWSFTTADGSGGIKAEYFTNMTLDGEPALTRTDNEINFNWGDGGPGDPIGADNFSARWTADLEISVADTYTFVANTDDGVCLWLNDERIINQWVDKGPSDTPSAAMDLEPGVYSLRMEYYENGGGAAASLYWQTPSVERETIPAGPLQPPYRARRPYPVHLGVDIPQDVTLTWSAGDVAASHNVYFGDDAAVVAAATPADAGIFMGSQTLDDTSFTPDVLEFNKTYYWRVDEVNPAEPGSPWVGAVWNFTTADFIVVDDFETYTNYSPDRVFQTWNDGWGYSIDEFFPNGSNGNGTRAEVGYDIWTEGTTHYGGDIMETAIVHGGDQAVRYKYRNADSPYYSEMDRSWDTPRNWTLGGVTDLSLWVRGYPAPQPVAVAENAGKIALTGSGADIWYNSDEFTFAYKTLNGDGSMVARVVSNGTGTQEWTKGGVMIRETLNGNSAHAFMAITAGGGNGASFQWRAATAADSACTDNALAAITPPYWVKVERFGTTFSGHVSPDGVSWSPIGTVEIPMANSAYVGLAVTSHTVAAERTYEFDNISAAGNWTGIVIDSPIHNPPAVTYITLQDSSNRSFTLTDPNTAKVNIADWRQWSYPLSSFTGVDATRIKRMVIGVGDGNVGGTGELYIDDIRVTKPEADE